jgi:hypothetical protein
MNILSLFSEHRRWERCGCSLPSLVERSLSLSLSCECRKARVCVVSLSLVASSLCPLIFHAVSGTARRFLAESIQLNRC